MKNKAQSSFEFTTTYAWALLIAAVAISGIFFFESTNNVAEDTELNCRVGPQFECTDVALDVTGNLQIEFKNNINKPVYLEGIQFYSGTISTESTNVDTTIPSNCFSIPRDSPVKPGGVGIIQCEAFDGYTQSIKNSEEQIVPVCYCMSTELVNLNIIPDPTLCSDYSVSGCQRVDCDFYANTHDCQYTFGNYFQFPFPLFVTGETTTSPGEPSTPNYVFDYSEGDSKEASFKLVYSIAGEEERFTTFGEMNPKVVESFGYLAECNFDGDEYDILGCVGEIMNSDCDDNDPNRGWPDCGIGVGSNTRSCLNGYECYDPDEPNPLPTDYRDPNVCNNDCVDPIRYCDFDLDYVQNTKSGCAGNTEDYDCDDNDPSVGYASCYDNIDCDYLTNGQCRNPGQCNSECYTCDADDDNELSVACGGIDQCESNPAVTSPRCSNDNQCPTDETCMNANSCDSYCINCNRDGDSFLGSQCGGTDLCDDNPTVGKSYVCRFDADCGSGFECLYGGTCSAFCKVVIYNEGDGGIGLPLR